MVKLTLKPVGHGIWVRRTLLALYGFGAIAAVVMTIVGIPDARLPWFVVAMFSVGCFIDAFRDNKAASERRPRCGH